MGLSTIRRSISPSDGDDWQSIAKRELGGTASEEIIGQLQSWNLHVFMRPPAAPGSPHEHNPILASDVIFLEPPLAS